MAYHNTNRILYHRNINAPYGTMNCNVWGIFSSTDQQHIMARRGDFLQFRREAADAEQDAPKIKIILQNIIFQSIVFGTYELPPF